jgi:RTX calcium-binding nonapeptide repeat (4 copies)
MFGLAIESGGCFDGETLVGDPEPFIRPSARSPREAKGRGLMRVWRIALVLGVLAIFGPIPALPAFAHTGCTITQQGDTQIWQGDEHDNTCNGQDGKDSMYGYGGNDTLHGGTGDDKLRGATGNDSLLDGTYGNDTDGICDGDGQDTLDVRDGDILDTVYLVYDNYPDTVYINPGDSASTYTADNCPI